MRAPRGHSETIASVRDRGREGVVDGSCDAARKAEDRARAKREAPPTLKDIQSEKD